MTIVILFYVGAHAINSSQSGLFSLPVASGAGGGGGEGGGRRLGRGLE